MKKLFAFVLLISVYCGQCMAMENGAVILQSENILKFVCDQTSAVKPTIVNKKRENYLIEISSILSHETNLVGITNALIVNSEPSKLTSTERGILLSLCLYQYSKKTGQYWPEVRDNFGVVPDVNIFFDENDIQHSDYAIYPMSSNKILFVQLTGRGAHNDGYLFWIVENHNDTLKVSLIG